MSSKILITGGTGLVGQRLSPLLTEKGYEVWHLSRRSNPNAAYPTYQWDYGKGQIDPKALEADHVIHLAGAGVADEKWTDARKQMIYDSRVKSTAFLLEQFSQAKTPLSSFISASAIGFYGMDTGDRLLTETSPAGNDFLAKVTRGWEEASSGFHEHQISTALVRIGVALDPRGGALEKMSQPVRFGAGAPLGSGKQVVSWIHVADLCNIFLWVLEHQKTGIYNAVAPKPETNKALTKAIAKTLGKPMFLPPVPPFVLKLMLGEMSAIVLGGNNVSAQKLLDEGFKFQFPDISSALSDLFH